MGERLHRKLQCEAARRASRRRDLLHVEGSQVHRGELAAPLQHGSPARVPGLQTASAGGLHPRLRRAAGAANPTSDAARAGSATLNANIPNGPGDGGRSRASRSLLLSSGTAVASNTRPSMPKSAARKIPASAALRRIGIATSFLRNEILRLCGNRIGSPCQKLTCS